MRREGPAQRPSFYGAYDVWPNTGHWLAAPGHAGAALVSLLCDEGEWQVTEVGTARDPAKGPLHRPHLPCRTRFIEHVVTSLFRYLMKQSEKESGAKVQVGKARSRAHRYAEEVVAHRGAGTLNVSTLNASLVGFCRKLRPGVCYSQQQAPEGGGDPYTPIVALRWLLGDLPLTDEGVRRWALDMCVDLNWSDQETMREMVQPEVLPALVKAGKVGPEAEHACLPEDLFPVVYRQLLVSRREKVKNAKPGVKGPVKHSMVTDQSHLNASRLLTLHLTGGGAGTVKYYGGWVRFQIAYRAGVLHPPPCATVFAGPRWGPQGRDSSPRKDGGDGAANNGPCPPGAATAATAGGAVAQQQLSTAFRLPPPPPG